MHNNKASTTAIHLYLPCLPFSVAIKLHPPTSQSFSMHVNMHYTSSTNSAHNKHKSKIGKMVRKCCGVISFPAGLADWVPSLYVLVFIKKKLL